MKPSIYKRPPHRRIRFGRPRLSLQTARQGIRPTAKSRFGATTPEAARTPQLRSSAHGRFPLGPRQSDVAAPLICLPIVSSPRNLWPRSRPSLPRAPSRRPRARVARALASPRQATRCPPALRASSARRPGRSSPPRSRARALVEHLSDGAEQRPVDDVLLEGAGVGAGTMPLIVAPTQSGSPHPTSTPTARTFPQSHQACRAVAVRHCGRRSTLDSMAAHGRT